MFDRVGASEAPCCSRKASLGWDSLSVRRQLAVAGWCFFPSSGPLSAQRAHCPQGPHELGAPQAPGLRAATALTCPLLLKPRAAPGRADVPGWGSGPPQQNEPWHWAESGAQASCQPVGTEGPSGRPLSLLPPAKATWASPQASAQDPPRLSCLTPCSWGSPSCLLPWTLVPVLLTGCPRETGRPVGDHRRVLCHSLALPPPGPSLGWGEQRGDVTGLPTLRTVQSGVSRLRVQQGPWDGEIRAPTRCTFF